MAQENVKKKIEVFGQCVDEVEDFLGSLKGRNLEEVSKGLTDEEVGQLHAMMGFSLTSCYHMYLKLQGIDVTKHPVRQELERVKDYSAKLKEAVLDKDGPALKVDTEAAGRMISHQINSIPAPAQPPN
eukprot:Platyproteum_vivax@DN4943_c0_g1_i1.p2